MEQEGHLIPADTELLLRLGNGDKHAFDILYNRYWKQVFNAAYKRLGDREQAQDIAQDVFIQLWTRASKAPIDNLSGYLMVATRNGVFKKMEKEAKYSALPESVHQMESATGADSGVLHQEFLFAFQALIETLPPQQRLIFKMRFEEELNSHQIAEKLEISVKTVRNQLGKALATLRSSLLLIHVLLFLYEGR
ncbi:RNA polymerase sigma factor [Pedobacter sp. GR22-6]|uniref:RNA polymerase sigma factor n=1 Tax=Pedobacter sp. GR22-6 TaxID=3127957 RepID=UPI00307EDEC8